MVTPEVDRFAAELDEAFAHDIIFEEAPGHDWENRDHSVDELAWLYEFEETSTSSRSIDKRTKAAQAVDKLLETYWP